MTQPSKIQTQCNRTDFISLHLFPRIALKPAMGCMLAKPGYSPAPMDCGTDLVYGLRKNDGCHALPRGLDPG